jgi:DNA-binding NarL/FixJ family response regulator
VNSPASDTIEVPAPRCAARRRPTPRARSLGDTVCPVWVFATGGVLVEASPNASAQGDVAQARARAALAAHLAGASVPGWRVTAAPLAHGAAYAVSPRRRETLASRWGLPPWLARVAEHVAVGESDKGIADALELPLRTVRTAVTRIYARLRVSSRVAVAHYALAQGIDLPRRGRR